MSFFSEYTNIQLVAASWRQPRINHYSYHEITIFFFIIIIFTIIIIIILITITLVRG